MKRFVLSSLFVCATVLAWGQYTPPTPRDTIYHRVDNYHYTSWYDTCSCFLDGSATWKMNFQVQSPFNEYYCGEALIMEFVSERTLIKGLATMVVKNWQDLFPNPDNTWHARVPEYIKLWKYTDSLPMLVDSVRWDTATPRLIMMPMNSVTGEMKECYVYEALLKDPIWVDTSFMLSTTGNSNASIFDTATNTLNVLGPPVLYACVTIRSGGFNCCAPSTRRFGLLNEDGPLVFRECDHWGWGPFFAILGDKCDIEVRSCDTTKGTVTGSGRFYEGVTDTLWALPEPGYRFDQWLDGSTENPRYVMVAQDSVFTACFVDGELLPKYTIDVRTENSLKGDVSGGGVYDSSQVVSITAVGHNGYRFDRWNDGDTSSPRDIVVVGDSVFTAYFVSETSGEDTTQNAIRMAERLSVSIAPNPTSGRVRVSADEPMRQVAVYDMAGKEVSVTVVDGQQSTADGEWSTDIDLADLPNGTYIVKVTTKAHTTTRKLIVE